MPEETPTKFHYSSRSGPRDYPVFNFKNEIVCVCPTQDLAILVKHAMEDFNKPEPEPARDVKPSTLKDLDTGEPVLFIKVSDFEAMRREIKAGKWALDACQKSEIELLKRAETYRAQLTERAVLIEGLESTIAALREDAAKDAQELRGWRTGWRTKQDPPPNPPGCPTF